MGEIQKILSGILHKMFENVNVRILEEKIAK